MIDLLVLSVCIYSFLFLILLMAYGWTTELVVGIWICIVGSVFGALIGWLTAMCERVLT